jgi:hypothetical protein
MYPGHSKKKKTLNLLVTYESVTVFLSSQLRLRRDLNRAKEHDIIRQKV